MELGIILIMLVAFILAMLYAILAEMQIKVTVLIAMLAILSISCIFYIQSLKNILDLL